MEETEREAGASQTTSLRGSGMEAGTEVSPVEVIVTGTETEDGTEASHEETGMETEMIGGQREKLPRKGQNSIWPQEVNQWKMKGQELLLAYLDLPSQWTPHKGKKKLKKNYQKCPRQRKVKMMRLEHINLRLEETMATGGGMTEDMIVTGETTGEDMTEGTIVMTEDMIEEMTEEDTTDR